MMKKTSPYGLSVCSGRGQMSAPGRGGCRGWDHYMCEATSAGLGLTEVFKENLWEHRWGCTASSE